MKITDAVVSPSAKIIKADATKDFFVTMITRDISLRDCIFDLLDNAIDGARRRPNVNLKQPFSQYRIKLDFDANSFVISDNCGGIRLSDAIDYAFNFGRKQGSPNDVSGGIGLYGIGMKRAIFKIGRFCEVASHAEDASFKVIIDVDKWERVEPWDFEYEDIATSPEKGTQIGIKNVNSSTSVQLADPAFKNELIRSIARDYAFFIQQGLHVQIGTDVVPSFRYQLMESKQLAPLVDEYIDDGVKVRILAGVVDDLPDDIPEDLKPGKVERYGWFVICNDRVVLAADKTEKTVWGDDGFNVWHPQYNFLAGFVFFQSADQRKLPWTTTKRSLDASSPLYRRAIERMKKATEPFIKYSNARKSDLDESKKAEVKEKLVDVSELIGSREVVLPRVAAVVATPKSSGITFRRLNVEIEEVKIALGNRFMSNSAAGEQTFDYFRKVEMGK